MKVDGVVNADVSFEKAEAVVTVQRGRVDVRDLTGAVQEAGFQAQVVGGSSGDAPGAAGDRKEKP